MVPVTVVVVVISVVVVVMVVTMTPTTKAIMRKVCNCNDYLRITKSTSKNFFPNNFLEAVTREVDVNERNMIKHNKVAQCHKQLQLFLNKNHSQVLITLTQQFN